MREGGAGDVADAAVQVEKAPRHAHRLARAVLADDAAARHRCAQERHALQRGTGGVVGARAHSVSGLKKSMTCGSLGEKLRILRASTVALCETRQGENARCSACAMTPASAPRSAGYVRLAAAGECVDAPADRQLVDGCHLWRATRAATSGVRGTAPLFAERPLGFPRNYMSQLQACRLAVESLRCARTHAARSFVVLPLLTQRATTAIPPLAELARLRPQPTASKARLMPAASSEVASLLCCDNCGDFRHDPVQLACTHRFCRRCIKRSPDCITCGQPQFERDRVSDPYCGNLVERLAVVVEQARMLGRLREPGDAHEAPAALMLPAHPRTVSAEAAAAAEERTALRERMEVLEKRMRAHHLLIVANARGALGMAFAHSLPRPPEEDESAEPPPPPQAASAMTSSSLAAAAAAEEGAAAAAAEEGAAARESAPAPSTRRQDGGISGGVGGPHREDGGGEEGVRAGKRPRRSPDAAPARPPPAEHAAPPAPASAGASASKSAPTTSATAVAPAAVPAAALAAALAAAPAAVAASMSPPRRPTASIIQNVMLLLSNSDEEMTKLVNEAVAKLGGRVCKKFQPNLTTHLVTRRPGAEANANAAHQPASASAAGASGAPAPVVYNCQRTLKYMGAVVGGKWIIDRGWVLASRASAALDPPTSRARPIPAYPPCSPALRPIPALPPCSPALGPIPALPPCSPALG